MNTSTGFAPPQAALHRPAQVNAGNGLWTELASLDLMLRRQVLRLRQRHQFVENEFRGTFISDEQVDALLGANQPAARPAGLADDLAGLTRQIDALRRQVRQTGGQTGLGRLVRLFGLNEVERHILLVALAPAIDLRYETVYAYVQNDVTRRQPSLDLALKLFHSGQPERLAAQQFAAPDAPLLRWRLIDLAPDPQDPAPPRLAHILRVAPRLVSWVAGETGLDPQLDYFARLVESESLEGLALDPEQRAALLQAAGFSGQGRGLVFLHGPPGAGKLAAAAGMAQSLGLRLLAARLDHLPQGLSLPDAVRLLQGEALLLGCALYLEESQTLAENPGQVEAFNRAIEQPACPVFIGSSLPEYSLAAWPQTPFVSLRLSLPGADERLELWRTALDGLALDPQAGLAALAGRFRLGRGQIEDAVRSAAAQAAAGGEPITAAALYRAARLRSSHALVELAHKIEPRYRLGDIILPPASLRQLQELLWSIRHRETVHTAWGFAGKLGLSGGMSALFYGPSGAGKTMAAEILAGELGLDLYRVDLSTVVSKYIGETEKNLGRVFAAAENSNAVLFFDEADALFGKRSEVRDSHDRYANLEISYLLQKIETFDGIAILATNLRGNMDEAFARRLGCTVEFPFPDAALRGRIWRAIFPAAAPLGADIDFDFLARQFELSGGNIRNVALSAAFLAAEERAPIGMHHLVTGVARELQKINRLPTRAAFRNFYDLAVDGSQGGARQ